LLVTLKLYLPTTYLLFRLVEIQIYLRMYLNLSFVLLHLYLLTMDSLFILIQMHRLVHCSSIQVIWLLLLLKLFTITIILNIIRLFISITIIIDIIRLFHIFIKSIPIIIRSSLSTDTTSFFICTLLFDNTIVYKLHSTLFVTSLTSLNILLFFNLLKLI